MNIGNVLLAIWLILVGVTWLGWVAISSEFLGLLAFITGIVVLLGGFGVIPVTTRRIVE